MTPPPRTPSTFQPPPSVEAPPTRISPAHEAQIQRKQAAEQSTFAQEEDETRPPIYRRPTMPLAVESILRSVLATRGLDKRLAAYQWVTHWEKIVGTGIARRTRPASLKKGVLTVEVTDSAWAQELQFRKQVIMARLAKFVNNNQLVTDVRFVVKARGR